MRGTIHIRNIGPKGSAELAFTGDGRTRLGFDLGSFGYGAWIISPNAGWTGDREGQWTELGEAQVSGIRPTTFPNILGDWVASYDQVLVAERDGDAVTLVLVEKGGQRHTVRVDPRTGDTLEWRTSAPGAPFPAITRFEDYRVVAGVRVPFRQVEVDPFMGETVFQFESAELTRRPDAGLFRAGE